MNDQLTRYAFAVLCGVFFLAIGSAAAWEWNRFKQGQSALSLRHLRWRLLSATVWLLVLGSFAFASVWLWPHSPRDVVAMRRFAVTTAGALLLMMVAFALMAFDIFWTVQIGRRSAVKRAQMSQDTLQRELERAQKRAASRNGGAPRGKS